MTVHYQRFEIAFFPITLHWQIVIRSLLMLSETQAKPSLRLNPAVRFSSTYYTYWSPLWKSSTQVLDPQMKILGSLKFISFFTFFLQKVICCPSSYTNKQTSFSLINCTPSKMNYYEITILAAKKVVIKNVL